MRMNRKGGDDFPLGKEVREMAADKTAGKGDGPESGASGSPFEGNAGMELSEKEIMEILQAQQQYERALEMARKYEEMLKTAEQKKKEIKPQVFKEIKEKYGIDEKEIKQAFKERERKREIIDAIIDTIEKEGSKACENKQFREHMDAWKRIRAVERMAEEDVKKIAVFIDEARKYMEEKEAEEGKAEIHHAGRMSEESIKLLRYVKEQGGRVTWKEFREYGKETLGLSTDTLNKRRWGLIDKGYIRREGKDIVITKKGLGRLEEEGC